MKLVAFGSRIIFQVFFLTIRLSLGIRAGKAEAPLQLYFHTCRCKILRASACLLSYSVYLMQDTTGKAVKFLNNYFISRRLFAEVSSI